MFWLQTSCVYKKTHVSQGIISNVELFKLEVSDDCTRCRVPSSLLGLRSVCSAFKTSFMNLFTEPLNICLGP